SATVGDARIPILRSFLPTTKPGNPGSTRKAVTPRGPLPASTVANSVITPACEPLEHQSLVPLRTYLSPIRTAVVRREAASEPAPGPEREYAARSPPVAIRGRSRRRCASVPASRIG